MTLMDEIKATGAEPVFHGAGFIKLELGLDRYLHVWHPDLPPTIQNGKIHDHRFSFQSDIVRGDIMHETFSLDAGDDVSVWSPPPAPKAAWYNHGKFYLRPEGVYSLAAGSRYSFPESTFHRIVPNGIAVTVMEKLRHHDQQPRIVSNTSQEPEDAFKIQMPNGAMWGAIFEACYGD